MRRGVAVVLGVASLAAMLASVWPPIVPRRSLVFGQRTVDAVPPYSAGVRLAWQAAPAIEFERIDRLLIGRDPDDSRAFPHSPGDPALKVGPPRLNRVLFVAELVTIVALAGLLVVWLRVRARRRLAI